MTNFEYYTQHVFPVCFRHFFSTFKVWADLMTNNYAPYVLLDTDNGFEICYDWFWYDLNDPELESKEFFEYLNQIIDDIDSGKEKLIPFDAIDFEECEKLLEIED